MSHGASSTIELVEPWLAGRTQHTARAYWGDLAWWTEELGGVLELRELTLTAVAAVMARHSERPASLARRVATLRSLLSYAHRVGYVDRDLSADIRPPRKSAELAARILEPSQVATLIAAARQTRRPERDRAIVRTLYLTGARASELCGLEWRDVRRQGKKSRVTLRKTKGGQERTILVPPTLATELAQLRELAGGRRARGPVFRSRTGAALAPRDVGRLVAKLARLADIEGAVSPHWLRHSHATHAIEAGAPLHVVATTLGHATLTTTTRYLHARPTESSGDFLPS